MVIIEAKKATVEKYGPVYIQDLNWQSSWKMLKEFRKLKKIYQRGLQGET